MKKPTNLLMKSSFAVAAMAAFALAPAAHAADLTWNAALPGNWDTATANWTGSTWNNGTPDNAILNNTNGTITLTEAITGGSLAFNAAGAASGAHYTTITASSLLNNLSLASVSVQGNALGNSVDNISPQAYDQRLTFDAISVSVSGDATVNRGMLYLLNANLNVSGQIKTTSNWNVFRSDTSTVTATGGIDFTLVASQVELYGGTVTTPFIKVQDAATINGQGGLFMGGGVTVVATGNSSDFIQVFYSGGGRNVAYITTGGMTLDTSSYEVTVATQLNGNGSLTKSGSGTLTLNQSNNYTGGTNVNQGMLVLAAGAWTFNIVGGGGVTVGSGATLRADNSVANQLNGLTLNGGTVDAINSSGNGDWGNYFLTGNVTATGTSNLNADVALRASNVDFNVATGGTLNVGGTLHIGYGYGTGYGSAATVSKSGDGTMVMTTTHTYTGATTVSAGTLKVSGSISNSDVTVNGGVLASGSTGTVGKIVTVNSGATFAAGGVGAVGTATVANDLNFSSGSVFDWDLTTGAGDGTYDTVSVTGALNITSGAKFNVVSSTAFTNSFWDATHTWSDIFGGKAIGNFLVSDFLYSGSATAPSAEGYFTVSGSSLTWTAVPEPTSALAGLLLTAGLLRRRRLS